MKIFLSVLFFLSITSFACSDNKSICLYGESMPYNGNQMLVEFYLHDVEKTAICKSSDTDFPLAQSVAIKKSLQWAKNEFDSSNYRHRWQ